MILLTDLLNYRNTLVLERYKKDYSENKMSPDESFSELMKYIWLCQQHEYDRSQSNNESLEFKCVMHSEMCEIDDMWHTFLLFTKDYYDFCMKYLGCFFHHHPLTDDDKKISPETYELELTKYLSYIYDNLGEKTLKKWFQV